MYVGIYELQVSARTIPFGIPLGSASLWSQNGKKEREEKKEREREVGIQIWWEMSSYGNVFASAVHEGENEQEKRSAIEGLSFSLYHERWNNITHCICFFIPEKTTIWKYKNTFKIFN